MQMDSAKVSFPRAFFLQPPELGIRTACFSVPARNVPRMAAMCWLLSVVKQECGRSAGFPGLWPVTNPLRPLPDLMLNGNFARASDGCLVEGELVLWSPIEHW